MLIAVNFHYVRPSFDSRYPGIHGVTPAQFERQLILLSKAGSFVSPKQILSAVRGERELPGRSFIVTFDDGLKEQIQYAWPVLKRLGIPALFFVNTLPIELGGVSMVHKIQLLRAEVAPKLFFQMLCEQAGRYGVDMALDVDQGKAVSQYPYDTAENASLKYLLNFTLASEERDKLIEGCFEEQFGGQESAISRDLYMDVPQIAELGSHGCIGTHASQHLPLGLLTDKAIAENIAESLTTLKRWTGYRPFALSYPYGSKAACAPKVARMALSVGIEFAFTMERAGNPNLKQPLFLARFANNDLPGGKAPKWAIEDLFCVVLRASCYLQVVIHGSWFLQ